MARFSVYAQGQRAGLLLDVQADLLSSLNTRIVIPLLPLSAAPQVADGLNPVFQIGGKSYAMVTQFMAAIPCKELKKLVATLESESTVVLAAIDFLHQGW